MKQKDKELLLKDICTRLPYGIKVKVLGWDEEKGEVAIPLEVYSICTDDCITLEYNHYNVESVYIEDCLLYLRPMSSMTKEEKEEVLSIIIGKNNKKFHVTKCGYIESNLDSSFKDNHFRIEYVNFSPKTVGIYTDWLNAHHFDYRGLIKMGLALEAPEGMYKAI